MLLFIRQIDKLLQIASKVVPVETTKLTYRVRHLNDAGSLAIIVLWLMTLNGVIAYRSHERTAMLLPELLPLPERGFSFSG